jgi:hypothetical protein
MGFATHWEVVGIHQNRVSVSTITQPLQNTSTRVEVLWSMPFQGKFLRKELRERAKKELESTELGRVRARVWSVSTVTVGTLALGAMVLLSTFLRCDAF